MTDAQPLTDKEIRASSTAWSERLNDDAKTSASETIWDEAWSAARDFYSEQERALRETLEWIANRKSPPAHEGTGIPATLRQVIDRANAVLKSRR